MVLGFSNTCFFIDRKSHGFTNLVMCFLLIDFASERLENIEMPMKSQVTKSKSPYETSQSDATGSRLYERGLNTNV